MKDLELKDKWVFDEVRKENQRQIEKWGIQDHNAGGWHLILAEEEGELAKLMCQDYFESPDYNPSDKYHLFMRLEHEAIQVATLSLKVAEMYHNLKEQIDLTRLKDDKNE